jgi:hypothetical protein
MRALFSYRVVIIAVFNGVFAAAAASAATGACDPLVEEYCMLPFPNDFWRVKTESGYRLNFTEDTFPVDDKGKKVDPVLGGWNSLHGFSVFPAMTTYFADVDESTIADCARWWNMDISLSSDSPITVLDATTNTTVAHWVELDHSAIKADMTGKHALFIWPSTALDFSHRYIVSIKQLKNKHGIPIKPSTAFSSIRDDHSDGRSGVDRLRKEHFNNNIFPLLASHGIERQSLLLTWDFTTNDKSDVTARMVSARDDARSRLQELGGPEYFIDSVQYNTSDLVGKIIKGQFRMPTYLNTHVPEKSARLVVDESDPDDVKSVFQAFQWYDFEVIVPRKWMDTPNSVGVLQYGHGLFGSLREVEYGSSTYMYEDATDYGYVICASTWLGLSEQDIPAIGLILLEDLSDFMYIPDRTTQGMVNALGLMMMLQGSFASHPVMLTSAGESIIIPAKTAYFGNSEGGIFGSVYMAVSQDVKRGQLGVPGGPYSLLLPRSLDFSLEYEAVRLRYSDPVDCINLMQVFQCLWDRAEPAGYMTSISKEPLPGTQSHEVLLHYGLGDSQVTWLGAHAIARSVNAVMYSSNAKENNETFFGFELLDDSVSMTGRSAIQGWDYNSPQAPLFNTPPSEEGDTHECSRRDDRAQVQMGNFFLTGVISNTCGGTCSAADKSTC